MCYTIKGADEKIAHTPFSIQIGVIMAKKNYNYDDFNKPQKNEKFRPIFMAVLAIFAIGYLIVYGGQVFKLDLVISVRCQTIPQSRNPKPSFPNLL